MLILGLSFVPWSRCRLTWLKRFRMTLIYIKDTAVTSAGYCVPLVLTSDTLSLEPMLCYQTVQKPCKFLAKKLSSFPYFSDRQLHYGWFVRNPVFVTFTNWKYFKSMSRNFTKCLYYYIVVNGSFIFPNSRNS